MLHLVPSCVSFLLALAPVPQAPALVPEPFPAEEYVLRRSKLYERIGPALALIQAAPDVRGFDVFRQSNEFYYLCGIETPGAYLLLDGRSRTTTLYLPHRNEERERNEGRRLSCEDDAEVREVSGVERVRPVELLAADFKWTLVPSPPPVLYVPYSPAEGGRTSRDELVAGNAHIASDPWDGRPSREGQLIGNLRARFPQFEIRDLTPHLDALRSVKTPRELDRLRRAGRLAALGVMEAMRSTRPGVMEYQLDAAARYVFRLNGARDVGYGSIVAGGRNAWMGHYFHNKDPLRAGDLVLMDAAPDLGYYTSDIGRMWPVDGTFDPAQRALCGFILAVHRALLAEIRPGITANEVMDRARPAMEQALAQTHFAQPAHEAAARKAVEWRGHLSHPVGMAVHDVGTYRDRPLEPGMVFSVDPMLWVPEEKLYIRVEDTVAVTEDGVEVLTAAAPTDLDAIEALVAEVGVVEDHPPETAAAKAPSWRLPRQVREGRGYDVEHYRIELVLDDARKAVTGRTTVTLRVLRPELQEVVLDAATFTVAGVTDGDGRALEHRQEEGRLAVRLAEPAAWGDRLELTVATEAVDAVPDPTAFGLAPDYPLGLRWREATGTSPRLAATMSWPTGARHWFPCHDHPADKATAEFHVTAPAAWSVLCNGALTGVTPAGPDARTWHWSQTRPHSTYLFVMAAGPFRILEDRHGDLPVSYWVYPQDADIVREGFGRTPEILAFFDKTFRVPFPWAKYDQVTVSAFHGGAESTSATVIGDSAVRGLYERGVRSMDWLIAHEAAHQWWGDLVTMRTWGDAWLSESFATYSEYLWTAHSQGPEEGARNLEQKRAAYFREARDRYMRPIVTDRWRHPSDIFDRHLYEKGALVLHMLRAEIGDEAFFATLTDFLQAHAFSTATTADFIRAAEDSSGRNLQDFFQQWLFRPGHPVLDVAWWWDAARQEVRIRVEQVQDRSHGVPLYRFPVQVAVETAAGTAVHRIQVDEALETFALPAAQEPEEVLFDPERVLLAEYAAGPRRLEEPPGSGDSHRH